MAQSSLLDSFDPFATHPFTNISGVVPQPPPPSRYAMPIPNRPFPSTQRASSPSSTTSSAQSSPSFKPSQGRSLASSPPQPIFVPFRKETSSPDLVLKKKAGLRY